MKLVNIVNYFKGLVVKPKYKIGDVLPFYYYDVVTEVSFDIDAGTYFYKLQKKNLYWISELVLDNFAKKSQK